MKLFQLVVDVRVQAQRHVKAEGADEEERLLAEEQRLKDAKERIEAEERMLRERIEAEERIIRDRKLAVLRQRNKGGVQQEDSTPPGENATSNEMVSGKEK